MEVSRLICRVRSARSRALGAASLEIESLLRDLGASPAAGGPLSEEPGVFWIDLPEAAIADARERLPRLGYTVAVDRLEAVPARGRRDREALKYRGRYYRLNRIYEGDEEALEEESPHRREFLFTDSSGEQRRVKGYRGSSAPGERRGLPACDARLLVNLAAPAAHGALLDPFAGAGGIVHAALAMDVRIFSCDIDPALAAGLADMGSAHCVADAGRLPFRDAVFQGVACEPPYDRGGGERALSALAELSRVLATGGRLACMCAEWQADPLLEAAAGLPLQPRFDSPVDRKGLACWIVLLEKR